MNRVPNSSPNASRLFALLFPAIPSATSSVSDDQNLAAIPPLFYRGLAAIEAKRAEGEIWFATERQVAQSLSDWDDLLVEYVFSLCFIYANTLLRVGWELNWSVTSIRSLVNACRDALILETFDAKHYGRFEFNREYYRREFERQVAGSVCTSDDWIRFQEDLKTLSSYDAAAFLDLTGKGTESSRSQSGPRPNFEHAARLQTALLEHSSDHKHWLRDLDSVCDILDNANVPIPKPWPKRQPRILSWADACITNRELARKAIKYHLSRASKQRLVN